MSILTLAAKAVSAVRCDDMATTSIWRVKGWLGKVVIYVENLLIKKEQKKTRGLFLWLFCHTYTFGSALYDCQFFIIECVKDDINLSTERGFISLLIRKYVLVSRYTKHRDKLNK